MATASTSGAEPRRPPGVRHRESRAFGRSGTHVANFHRPRSAGATSAGVKPARPLPSVAFRETDWQASCIASLPRASSSSVPSRSSRPRSRASSVGVSCLFSSCELALTGGDRAWPFPQQQEVGRERLRCGRGPRRRRRQLERPSSERAKRRPGHGGLERCRAPPFWPALLVSLIVMAAGAETQTQTQTPLQVQRELPALLARLAAGANISADQADLSVVCNSRCRCLVLAKSSQRPASDETDAPASPDNQRAARADSTKMEAEADEQRRSLEAFSLDYSLDYEAPSAPGASSTASGAAGATGRPKQGGNGNDSEAANESPARAGSNHRPASAATGRGEPASDRLDDKSVRNDSLLTGRQTQSPTAEPQHAPLPAPSPPPAFGALPFNAPSGGEQPQARPAAAFQQQLQSSFHTNNPAKLIFRKLTQQQQQSLGNFKTDDGEFKVERRKALALGLQPGERLERLIQLKTLELTNGRLNLSENEETSQRRLVEMLVELEKGEQQALDLRNNSIQFEQWSELYALLSMRPLHRHLIQLDLSQNSLVKLGVTFTGYIEHHLIAAANSTGARAGSVILWPFGGRPHSAGQNANSSSSGNATGPPSTHDQMSSKQQNSQAMRLVASLRHQPVLGDGRLFNSVQSKLNYSFGPAPSQQQHNLTSVAPAALSVNAANGAESGEEMARPQHATWLLHELRAIDLSHNKLKWLINDQFRAIRKVQSIRLDHNKIRFIHQQAFNGLESLKYLNLNSNRLQTIYIEQFQTNYNLLALFLRANYLAYLRAGSFAALSNLKRLDLSGNKFAILSNNAFVGLESLETLNCSWNQFVHVPLSSLHPLQRLKVLDFSANQFSQLTPGSFFHLPIVELRLKQNEHLMSIERGAFWDLPSLQRLSLSSNQMLMSVSAQAFVGAAQNLKQIEADECPLLDAQTRQMLENITATATSRSLAAADSSNSSRPFAEAEPPQSAPPPSLSANGTTNVAGLLKRHHHHHHHLHHQMAQTSSQPRSAGPPSSESGPLRVGHTLASAKFLYSIGSLLLVLLALNLVLKHTSTRRLLVDAHRRRRRVYMAGGDALAPGRRRARPACGAGREGEEEEEEEEEGDERTGCDSASSSSSMGETEAEPGASRAGRDLELASSTSLRDDAQSLGYGENFGQEAFAMCERPHEVLHSRQTAQTDRPASGPAAEPTGDTAALQTECDETIGVEQAGDTAMRPSEGRSVILGEGAAHGVELGQQQLSFGLDLVMDCPDCRQQQQRNNLDDRLPLSACCSAEQQQQQQQQEEGASGAPATDPAAHLARCKAQPNGPEQTQMDAQQMEALNLIHTQLVAAGFDYGHANCAHFYQSLGPALHFADLTANFVNQMEHHFY